MHPRHMAWLGLGAAGATSLIVISVAVVADEEGPPTTPVEEVVMYGVDDDTDQLLRYAFSAQEYLVIGQVRDQDGNLVDEIESLAYIPSGPDKGLYGVTNYDGNVATRLARINILDAKTTVYPVDTGFGNVEGMVAVREPATDKWVLYATNQANVPQGGGGKKNLISIDPATGLGTLVMKLDRKFEGLAKGPDGTLYAAKGDELWMIDPLAGTNTRIGEHDYDDVEALEFAFGDNAPQIDVPGVPQEWTENGILFGASDEVNSILILNPATGEAMPFGMPFATPDWEGMVFMTKLTDPYRVILEDVHD